MKKIEWDAECPDINHKGPAGDFSCRNVCRYNCNINGYSERNKRFILTVKCNYDEKEKEVKK
jgi:hypothetical protein